MQDLFDYTLGGNTAEAYLTAAAAFLIILGALLIFRWAVLQRMKNVAAKSEGTVDNVIVQMISSLGVFSYVVIALYLGSRYLVLPENVQLFFNAFVLIAILFYVIRALRVMTTYALTNFFAEKSSRDHRYNKSTIRLVERVVVGILWMIAILMILQNVGVDVTALVAGLGIGGVVLAFALQNVLTELFASFSLSIDPPFEEGDFVTIGKDSGTVQRVGFQTTRIKTLQGEQLVIPNRVVAESELKNFNEMKRRRVDTTLSLEYGTSSNTLEKIPAILEEIISEHDDAEFLRATFLDFSESSLDILLSYYVTSPEYVVHIELKHKINLAIKKRFEKEKIEFAYPTTTVHLKK